MVFYLSKQIDQNNKLIELNEELLVELKHQKRDADEKEEAREP
ncbi:hypothetical protein [Halobacillus litoralis]|nr:hypothetical protein [Halobacillus litoralis]